jgi:hypothetical protein
VSRDPLGAASRVEPGPLSVECELLLLLSRVALGPALEARARELARAGPSWAAIAAMARAHGVYPLVHEHLSRGEIPGVAPAARAELADAQRRNAARNALFARELAGLLERFAAAGVSAIPLKGVALARSLYGDVSRRACSDLDVLVERGAVAEAFGLLHELGYERAEGEEPVSGDDLGLLLESNMEYGFAGPAPFRCPVELHWDIAWRWPGAETAARALWAESRPAAFGDAPARALSPEWDLLYLAVHAARHRFGALKWLVDLHERCGRGDIDGDRARETAARLGWGRVLSIALGACRALLGTALPAGLSAAPPPAWLPLFPASAPRTGMWRDAVYPARLFARPADKLRYLARVAFVPTLGERRSLRLPRALGFAHYGWRPVRLGGKGAARLTRLALHASARPLTPPAHPNKDRRLGHPGASQDVHRENA